ncbi:longitudinals lacking protein, isoforms H/M/V isoform X10 [Hyalella azteca]|uniref:Longitudinals lacking protein, isoforms H/M/V isoform X10 n=1 Tax=Hyalella azteca TaxID=294128 RepID=A0A8B7PAK3_HYAAZ|nr:longitudinals lacking protein, isoforms H/M/V isoform X10 [Hyalella azteca]
MATGLLSLKWNNHRSTFFHVLSNIRSKESYSDVTLACDGRFYSLHKFVLSTCSEYFEEMFERTQCKHPVIVLKDINSEDLEALLNYMYVGEVNVVQEKLAGLIKAAECLKIKGLAVPDEDPMESKDNSSIGREQHKRSQRGEDSPRAKRRRRENSSDVSEEILSPVRSRPSGRSRDHHHHHHHHGSHNAKSAPVAPSGDNEDGTRETQGLTDASEEAENSSINANRRSEGSNKNKSSSQIKSKREPEQMMLDGEEEGDVKTELQEADNNDVEEVDNKASLHEQLGLDMRDASNEDYDNAALLDEQHDESNLAGASGYQENSFLWEGDGSLSGFSAEGFTSEASQARQMVPPSILSSVWYSRDLLEGRSDFPSVAESSGKSSSSERPLMSSDKTGAAQRAAMPDAVRLRRYECSNVPPCGLSFNSPSELKRHMLVHTGERPYSCPQCAYSCNRKFNLRQHCFLRHQISMKHPMWL